jgi:hypothetical protein
MGVDNLNPLCYTNNVREVKRMNSVYKVYRCFYAGQGFRMERTLVLKTSDYSEAIAKAQEIDNDGSLCYSEVIEEYIGWTTRKVY